MRQKERVRLLKLLWAGSLLILLFAPLFGLTFLNPFDSNDWLILVEFRFPKVVATWLVGASLALSGMVFQALLRNPLADPYILGVASGSSFGAAIALYGGINFVFLWVTATELFAFLGALGVTLFLYLSAFRGDYQPLRLILLGVIISLFIGSLLLLLQAVGPPEKGYALLKWMMGRIDYLSYGLLFRLFLLACTVAGVLYFTAPQLNLISNGLVQAQVWGLNPHRLVGGLFLTMSLMIAFLVAHFGPIGFIGLIVPHIARLLLGDDYRLLWWGVIPLGGGLLLLANLGASLLFRPAELPVGVITALLGAPFFLLLLLRREGR